MATTQKQIVVTALERKAMTARQLASFGIKNPYAVIWKLRHLDGIEIKTTTNIFTGSKFYNMIPSDETLYNFKRMMERPMNLQFGFELDKKGTRKKVWEFIWLAGLLILAWYAVKLIW